MAIHGVVGKELATGAKVVGKVAPTVGENALPGNVFVEIRTLPSRDNFENGQDRALRWLQS
jgi:hypothetical protein